MLPTVGGIDKRRYIHEIRPAPLRQCLCLAIFNRRGRTTGRRVITLAVRLSAARRVILRLRTGIAPESTQRFRLPGDRRRGQ